MSAKIIKENKVKYYLNNLGEFVIENYNFSKPLANFFPGIAGKYGIPMWVFYVNRGQGICSFGTSDKNHSIVEFFPANRAWQMVSSLGFRTFIKLQAKKKNIFYEPFHNGIVNLEFALQNKMCISPYGLALEETNETLGLKINVDYFNIPNQPYAGLARVITLANLGRKSQKIQLLDGLAQIVPYGTTNLFLKKLSRTIEAWMQVKNLDKKVPYYKVDVDPTDRPEVTPIRGGNFYLGFHHHGRKTEIIKPITDPQNIFGTITDFSYPQLFLHTWKFKSPDNEIVKSKTPCGFLLLDCDLRPGAEKTFYSIIGYAQSQEALNASLSKITQQGYLENKKEEAKKIIEELQEDIFTSSSSKEFNLYVKQTYLDNILRGGYPTVLESKGQKSVFYLYSRKHGDLERDYNKFHFQPTYFSQGNGNYRDANQNRRSDVWFNPEIDDENLMLFFNLIQTDGFNPLVVKGISFVLNDEEALALKLKGALGPERAGEIISFIKRPFTPGELMMFVEKEKIKLGISYEEFVALIISCCGKIQEAEHGEGFWTDHWTYNLDLLESYLGLYPERLREIIFEKKAFTYFDNMSYVKPREEKHFLKDGLARQFQSVVYDHAKGELIRSRTDQPHMVRRQYGQGEIYCTTLINKLFCLLSNKLASLDPFGMGIEMEADKPNWFDSLNGLPGLFGSSLCETFELKRLVIFIKDALTSCDIQKVFITEEVYNLLSALNELIKENIASQSPDKDYLYWDKSCSLKEEYRQKTKFGFEGRELEIPTSELIPMLDNALKKLNLGIEKAWDKKDKIYYSYFINEVSDYKITRPNFIKVTGFTQKKVPYFLEGQMHALRLAENIEEAKLLYEATRKSSLFDKELKMYKVTAALKEMPLEIGRCRVFTPGWLENESVWLHMEYKYLLEILKHGLCEEFYRDFKNILIPFQDPQRYGRSILENSSFLVSSAFPDKKLHGNGFVARLSGSTAEMIQIWLIMNLGCDPFYLDGEKKLCLRIQPALAGWLFDRKGNYSFNFLKTVRVNYHNPRRKDTFGSKAAKISKITFSDKNGKPLELPSNTIPSPYAEQVRSRQIKEINVYFK